MDIIVRQVLGGCRARLSNQTKFAKRGKSRLEALGNLLVACRKQFKVGKVQWDKKDPWTANYLAGKPNQSKKISAREIDWRKFPRVDSSEQARYLEMKDLPIPIRLINATQYALSNPELGNTGYVTLGRICECTEKELHEKGKRRNSQRLGGKSVESIKKILSHYGLKLKKEPSNGPQ